MEPKRVSLEVAKALKEAGYPQQETNSWGYVIHPGSCYFTGKHSYIDDYRESRIEWDDTNKLYTVDDWADEIEPRFYGSAIAAPTYLEVWIWLWREKKKCIDIVFSEDEDGWTFMQNPSPCDCGLYQDPEEAIISAINYLVDNNLIK